LIRKKKFTGELNDLEMTKKVGLIVIGGSSGGLQGVMQILAELPDTFLIPVVVVLHQLKNSSGRLIPILQSKTKLKVKEPLDKEKIESGSIYIAPPDYHLLIEDDFTFGYSYSETVNHSRPSIDVLFESASNAYKKCISSVLLSGASMDGAQGTYEISKKGGCTVVLDPDKSEMPVMPRAAIKLNKPDHVVGLYKIGELLNQFEYGFETT
jgi:two-component system, chemotaxis family, protein-glutamate methylesterase/glutaminase